MVKRIISAIVAQVMILGLVILPAKAGSEVSVPITVEERSGKKLESVFIRRGFALPEGMCRDAAELALVSGNGEITACDFSVTQRYPDGSIKWGLAAFVCSLAANEKKNYTITGGNSAASATAVFYSENGVFSNENVAMKCSERGIADVVFGGNTGVSELTLFADDSSFKATSAEILSNGNLYKRIKISGTVGESFRAEIIAALWSGAKCADIEYRFTAVSDTTVGRLGVRAVCSDDITSGGSGSVLNKPYIDAELSNGGKVSLSSFDNERFSGALCSADETGFIVSGNEIISVPLLNNGEFLWPDGMSRTFHVTLSFGNGEESYRCEKYNPFVTIAPESFAAAGIIAACGRNAVTGRIEKSVEYAMERNGGCLEAGYLPSVIDEERKKISGADIRPGENEYNIAAAQMATGSGILYNAIMQSAESWADTAQYKGAIAEVYGANRYYRGAGNAYQSTLSHPYYGDSDGLYAAYLLSGNEYFRECFRAAADNICVNMENSPKNLGFNFPHMVDWGSGKPVYTKFAESRYIIQARPMYSAYELFGEEKYKNAMNSIIGWSQAAQTDEGYWYQAYYADGTPYTHAGQSCPAVKNYIFLYGTRALSGLADKLDNAVIDSVLNKEAEFLCSEISRFGAGLWNPTGDSSLYETNEDGSRGKAPKSDIMAADILLHAYLRSGNEKFLNAAADELNIWLCALGSGGLPTTLSLARGYGDGAVSSAEAQQNLTVCTLSPTIMSLIKNGTFNKENNRFCGIAAAFSEGSAAYNDKDILYYSYPEVTQTVYDGGGSSVLYAMNVNGAQSNYYTKNYVKDVETSALWSGMTNTVSAGGKVRLSKTLGIYEGCFAVKLPVYISGNTSKLVCNVEEYSGNAVALNISGSGTADLKICSGIFPAESGKRYSYAKTVTENGISVAIRPSESGVLLAVGDEINIRLNISETEDCYAKVVSENRFDEYEDNSILNEWGGTVKAFPSAENKSLYATGSIFNRFSPVNSKTALFSYDYYISDRSRERRLMQIYDSAKTAAKRTAVIFAKPDGTLNANGGNFITYYPKNEWFNLTVAADMDNKVMDIYVDRRLCAENVPFYSGANADEAAVIETVCSGGALVDNACVLSGYSSLEEAKAEMNGLFENAYHRVTADRYKAGDDARIIKGMSITGTPSNIVIADFPSDDNKSLKFAGGGGVSWLWNALSDKVSDGSVIISQDFFFKSPVSARLIEVYSEIKNGETRSVYIGADAGGRFTVNESIRNDFKYSCGKWYNVTAIANIDTGKYSVYINGTHIGEFPFFRGTDSAAFVKTIYNEAPPPGGEMYTDNIYCESFPSYAAAETAFKLHWGKYAEAAECALMQGRGFARQGVSESVCSELDSLKNKLSEEFPCEIDRVLYNESNSNPVRFLPQGGIVKKVTFSRQPPDGSKLYAVFCGNGEIKQIKSVRADFADAVFDSEIPPGTEYIRFYLWNGESLAPASETKISW